MEKDINKLRGVEFATAYADALREELNNQKGKWAALVRVSNGKFSYSWLNAFSVGRPQDNLISTLAELGNYLGLRLTTARCQKHAIFTAEEKKG